MGKIEEEVSVNSLRESRKEREEAKLHSCQILKVSPPSAP